MLTHRGFSAWIVSGGSTLEEYLVAVDENANRVSCWIPGEEGQTFTVYWKDHGGKVDTCAFISLDGFVVPGRFLFGTGMAWREGVRTGNATERPFVFSKVDRISGESLAKAATRDLGMIVLRIKRVERSGSRPANVTQTIPELKFGNRRPGDLCIGFGQEKQAYAQYSTTWAVKPYHEEKLGTGKPSTHVTFVFRYRSREFLEAQGIAPEVEAPTKSKKVPIRRAASAPAPPVMSAAPVTPSPSPSPKRKAPAFSRMGSAVVQALSRGQKRLRKTKDTRRVVTMWGPTKNETFPGEGLMRFDPTSPTEGDEDESTT